MLFRKFHLIHFKASEDLKHLYLSNALRQFGFALIGLFVPLYFLKLGYGLDFIALFFISASLTYALTIIPLLKLVANHLRKLTVFSSVLLILSFWMLYSLPEFHWNVIVLGMIFGLNWLFFWPAYHINFALDTDRKHRGEEVGVSQELILVVSALGPLFGGLIISVFSFNLLFLLTGLIFLSSAIPLFYSKELFKANNFSVKRVFSKKHFRTALGFFGWGVDYHSVNAIVWPIFVFLVLKEYVSFGLIFSVGIVVSIIITYAVMNYSDRLEKIKVLRFSALYNSLACLARIFSSGFASAFTFNSALKVGEAACSIPLESVGFDRANQENVVEITILREFSVHLGVAALFSFLLLTNNLVLALILGAIASFLYLFY